MLWLALPGKRQLWVKSYALYPSFSLTLAFSPLSGNAANGKTFVVENQYMSAPNCNAIPHQLIVRIYNLYFNQICTRLEKIRFRELIRKVSLHLLRIEIIPLEIRNTNQIQFLYENFEMIEFNSRFLLPLHSFTLYRMHFNFPRVNFGVFSKRVKWTNRAEAAN